METIVFLGMGLLVAATAGMGFFCMRTVAVDPSPSRRRLQVQRAAYMNMSVRLMQMQRALHAKNRDLHALTERVRKTNEDLNRTNELKSRFFHMVTHEIRNPVGMIGGFSEILSGEEGEGLSEKQRWYFDAIFDSARRAQRLMNDLTDLAAVESGGLKMRCSDTRLAPWLRDLLPSLEFACRDKRVRLATECVPEDAWMSCDPHRLGQVLINLVTNAVKFSPADGAVEAKVSSRGRHVRITVTDHGVGFGASDKEKIFEPFYQADNHPAETGKKGMGLGLYIVREIVKAHRGRVWAESAGHGAGATFFVELPITQEEKVQ